MLNSRQSRLGLGLLIGLSVLLHFSQLNVLPPGLFGDEALVSLRAREAVASQSFPVYFGAADGGFHPALVYLTILARWLTGNHLLAVRFGVAAVGVLSTPLVYFALRAIFQLDDPASHRAASLALLGTLIFTIAFPSILIHRLGFEVMLPAPAGALVFLGLALALRTGQRRYYILSGAALGLALYTYYSARLLPAAVVVSIFWAASLTRQWRRAVLGLGLVTAVSVVVFAPLGVYFLNHPDMFLARAISTSEQTRDPGWNILLLTLLNNLRLTLGGLSLPGYGDVIPRHNLPGRPAFDAFLSSLLWLGVAGLVLRRQRPASALLAAWAGAMLLPVILTVTNQSPHFTRMAGAMPALAGIGALGAGLIFDRLAACYKRLTLTLIALGLVGSLSLSVYDYFVRWATDERLFDAFQIGDWQAARLARERATSQPVYLSPRLLTDYSHATFNLMLNGGPVRDFPGPHCLVYHNQSTQPQTYIIDVLNDRETPDRLRALFPNVQSEPAILSQNRAWELYEIFQAPAGATATPPARPAVIAFGDALQLIGYSLTPSSLTVGSPLTITLYWQAAASPLPDYTVFVHLYPPDEAASAPPIAQNDAAPCQGRFPTSGWQTGDIVLDEHTLTLPGDAASDSVVIALGIYTWPALERISPVVLASSDAALLPENRVLLTTLPVRR
jgi:4-amino-4-deoxy-L-arabinose transferase-like glycosyltransferase